MREISWDVKRISASETDFGVSKTNMYGIMYIEITFSVLKVTSSCSIFQAMLQHTYGERSNDLQCAAVTAVTKTALQYNKPG